jgi:DNA-binding NarL/FixJ family response regulator
MLFKKTLKQNVMDNKTTILIAEDHTLIREAWVFMLNNEPGFRVIAEVSDGDEAVRLTGELKPDIVILDINLRGRSGIEVVSILHQQSPGSRVLGVSCHIHPAYARLIIQNGGSGYITKTSPFHELVKAITEINGGKEYICKEIRDIIAQSPNHIKMAQTGINSLSQREVEVIEYIKKGNSSKQIAWALNISKKTIEVHRYNIMKKLNLGNVAALVNYINNSQLELGDRYAN